MATKKTEEPAPMRAWKVRTEDHHGRHGVIRVEAISGEEARDGVANADKSITVVGVTPAG